MTRVRTIAALFALTAVLGMAPAAFAQDAPPPGDEPAVVFDEGAAAPEDQAWTFRFLVPTVLAMSGLIVLVTVVGYGVRVRGRYRVVR